VCRYAHDGDNVPRDGFGLSVYDGVNKLSKHVPVLLSTRLPSPAPLRLVEGRSAPLAINNLLAPRSTSDAPPSYTSFDVVLAPADISVRVGDDDATSFTSQQVRQTDGRMDRRTDLAQRRRSSVFMYE